MNYKNLNWLDSFSSKNSWKDHVPTPVKLYWKKIPDKIRKAVYISCIKSIKGEYKNAENTCNSDEINV
jgi:hypothetical protein